MVRLKLGGDSEIQCPSHARGTDFNAPLTGFVQYSQRGIGYDSDASDGSRLVEAGDVTEAA